MISGNRFLSRAPLRRRPVAGSASTSSNMSAKGWAERPEGRDSSRSRTTSDLDMWRASDSCSRRLAKTSGSRIVKLFTPLL